PAGFRSIPLTPAQLKLDTVLRCGQSFLWHVYPLTASSATSTLSPPSSSIDPSSSPTEPTHEYRLCLPDRLVCLRQSPSHLFYRAVFPPSSSSSSSNSLPESEADSTLAWLTSYFQLPIDLPALYARWSSTDPAFARLSSRPALAGIRVLRQDPWECLLSFICSQNNHISRITKLVHALPEEYSDVLVEHDHPLGGEQVAYRPFPGPEALASPEVEPRLRELGFGYRAKYIQGTAAALVARASGTKHTPREWLGALRLLPLPEARAALLALPGVGPKVADCVLLMSLDQPGVVPVDTHVLQIAVRHYGLRAGKGKGMTPALYAAIGERFAQVWGEYAGWAQGVVFAGDLREFA
ncbi:DNA glycosylase, partial [Calocera viscosa TUFC12733]